jgi:TRAP-type mannitol/chloroaromatic compound transport system permease small subunit
LEEPVTPVNGARTIPWAVDRLSVGFGYVAGAMYVVQAFFITYDVLARKWGAQLGLPTTQVTDEISGYMLALAATWGLAYALRCGSHVRIDVVFPYLAPRLRAAADFMAFVLMTLFATIVSWKIWALVADSWQSGLRSSTYLLTPLYVPQLILGVGFSLLALAAACIALAMLAGWELPGAPGPEQAAEPPVL